MEELFSVIFLRYSPVNDTNQAGDSENKKSDITAGKKSLDDVDLTEDEKTALLASKHFTEELEQCIFEIYSEPDKQGQPCAGSKYKYDILKLQLILHVLTPTVQRPISHASV